MTADIIDQDGLKLASESGDRYLGSLPVVDHLVRTFAAGVARDYAAWIDGGDDPTTKIEAECRAMGDLFLGRELAGFIPQPWNSEARLGTQLRVALKCGEKDPGYALFEHLAQCVLSAAINHGDGAAEDAVRSGIESQVSQVVSALLGAPTAL